jgi:hypothetical protein
VYADNATFGALQLDYGSVQRVSGSDVERLLHDEVDAIVNCPWVLVLVVVLPVIMRGARVLTCVYAPAAYLTDGHAARSHYLRSL